MHIQSEWSTNPSAIWSKHEREKSYPSYPTPSGVQLGYKSNQTEKMPFSIQERYNNTRSSHGPAACLILHQHVQYLRNTHGKSRTISLLCIHLHEPTSSFFSPVPLPSPLPSTPDPSPATSAMLSWYFYNLYIRMELLTIKQPIARAGLTASRTWGEYSVSKLKKSSPFYLLCWISDFINMRVIYSNSCTLVLVPLETNPLRMSYITQGMGDVFETKTSEEATISY